MGTIRDKRGLEMSEEKHQRFWNEFLKLIEGKLKIIESKLEKEKLGDSEND